MAFAFGGEKVSRAVLISIQPKWCRLIAVGSKTVEVRKTRPMGCFPFKVYIYCTKDNETKFWAENGIGNGKVVGHFTLNTIDEIVPNGIYNENSGTSEPRIINNFNDRNFNGYCLTNEQLKNYLGNNRGFGWRISELVFYDTPKELSEFGKTIPPQSWCYVDKE